MKELILIAMKEVATTDENERATTDENERTGFDDTGKDVIVTSDSDPDESMVLASCRF